MEKNPYLGRDRFTVRTLRPDILPIRKPDIDFIGTFKFLTKFKPNWSVMRNESRRRWGGYSLV